jgi:fructose-bisphosphate aldolase class 1
MKGSITTVKVDNGLYESFKIQNIKSKFHLQDLVNRAMYLYLNDKEFKDKLYNLIIPVLSEEAQITKLNITGSTI